MPMLTCLSSFASTPPPQKTLGLDVNNKDVRAQIIISKIIALNADHGFNAPARGNAGMVMGRMVQTDRRWHARLSPGLRITMARHYENRVGSRIIPDADWRLFELEVFNQPKLVANLRGSEIHLHSYAPGDWESWLGVDNGGDTVLLDPWIFADPDNPLWQAVEQSADFQLPPLRNSPPNDGPRTSSRRLGTRRLHW